MAYLAGARWISPAPTLFDEALTRAFQTEGAPRLASRGASPSPPYTLSLDVQTFEARYENGPKAAPVVVVSVRAVLVDTSERRVLSDQIFFSRQPAADNRVSAIVNAYDAAVSDVLGRIVDWAGHRGQA
jgi:cholesterol transport system auxiliary component